MRRVLVALAMTAACVLVTAPAIAQEDADGPGQPGGNATEGVSPPPTDAPTPPESSEPPAFDADSSGEAEGGGNSVSLLAVEDVRLCHARSAESNPYGPRAITVSVQSIFNPNNGHDTHDGPVFPAADWGDIIPPFEHEDGFFDGLNWNAEGQAIYFNNCQPLDDEEPPPPGEEEISICHADANPNQPYGPGPISPSVNSIVNPNGHGTHTGPVFFPGILEQWGDIIPPFEYGDNESFPGLNWDADGQAIYFNDCIFTDGPPPPGDDDDDEGDDDDDGGEDSDDEEAALPDTGGPSLWILVVGTMLIVFGASVLVNRRSTVVIEYRHKL